MYSYFSGSNAANTTETVSENIQNDDGTSTETASENIQNDDIDVQDSSSLSPSPSSVEDKVDAVDETAVTGNIDSPEYSFLSDVSSSQNINIQPPESPSPPPSRESRNNSIDADSIISNVSLSERFPDCEKGINLGNTEDITKLFGFILDKLEFLTKSLEHEKIRNSRYEEKIALLDQKISSAAIADSKSINEGIEHLITKNVEMEKHVNELEDYLYDFDTRIIEVEQYSRRPSLVISGIPKCVKQNELQSRVIEILNCVLPVDIHNYDVVACHRLGRSNGMYPAQTIVRFVNRKNVEYILQHRADFQRHLKSYLNLNVRFFEHLCDANEEVRKSCKILKEHNYIHNYYSRNGFFKIVVKEGDSPLKIKHIEILREKFDVLNDSNLLP